MPYLGLGFDCDSYEDFAACNSWDKGQLERGNFDQAHDRATAAAFLQSWLYFGSLRKLYVAGRRSPLMDHDSIKSKIGTQVATAKVLDNFYANMLHDSHISKRT